MTIGSRFPFVLYCIGTDDDSNLILRPAMVSTWHDRDRANLAVITEPKDRPAAGARLQDGWFVENAREGLGIGMFQTLDIAGDINRELGKRAVRRKREP